MGFNLLKQTRLYRRLRNILGIIVLFIVCLYGFYKYISFQAINYTFEEVLIKQRQLIKQELINFDYTNINYGIKAEKLSDLTPETNGTPIRGLIVTTWRSGSSFFGAILNSIPASYYEYEPLLQYGIRIKNPSDSHVAISMLNNLFRCNYSNEYIDFRKALGEKVNHEKRNIRLWEQCKQYSHICYEKNFRRSFCELFPFYFMKIVRLKLSFVDELLADESLNLKVVFLIRDPRGVLLSRKHSPWCNGHPDCDRAENLCEDMIADYYSALNFTKKYPMKFKVVRYEDLSLNPYNKTQEILQFYGLPYDPKVKLFLDIHTKTDKGDNYSIFRNSNSTPFHWIRDLTHTEIFRIQEKCDKAMELWGYRLVKSEDEINELFNPLLESPFS